MRKHPVRHKVHTHTRKGKTVHSYIRGRGQRTSKMAKPTIRTEGSSRKTFEDYKIVFYYSKKRKETVLVAAHDSDDALNIALKKRKYKGLKPIKLEVIDGLGSILGSVVGSVAGGISSALGAFRTSYAKGAKERAEFASIREESNAQKKAWIEKQSRIMVDRARTGDRPAQLWCEKYHIAWEQV